MTGNMGLKICKSLRPTSLLKLKVEMYFENVKNYVIVKCQKPITVQLLCTSFLQFVCVKKYDCLINIFSCVGPGSGE